MLDRIARDSTTVVCPVIDVIDDTTLEFHWKDSSGVNVGGFDWNLQVTLVYIKTAILFTYVYECLGSRNYMISVFSFRPAKRKQMLDG